MKEGVLRKLRGIHCSKALVGMTRFKGSIGTRMTYTASGNVTNLAAKFGDCIRRPGDLYIMPLKRKDYDKPTKDPTEYNRSQLLFTLT